MRILRFQSVSPQHPYAAKASPEGKISASRLRGATEGECEYLGFRVFHPNIRALQRRPHRVSKRPPECHQEKRIATPSVIPSAAAPPVILERSEGSWRDCSSFGRTFSLWVATCPKTDPKWKNTEKLSQTKV